VEQLRYLVVTFGCQMNEADSSLMAASLDRAGWRAADSAEDADLVVLNTCSVRQKPERKVHGRLGELRRWKADRPDAVIAVAGCMAQREGENLLTAAPHVDLVVGTRHFHRLPELAQRARAGERPLVMLEMAGDPSAARSNAEPPSAPAPLRAFVPVIRGCGNFCSYCIVPFVRGPETSRPADDVLDEVKALVARGTREVTLLGQNVLAYGRDLPDPTGFPELLRTLDAIPDLWRIRFTTCHPRDVTSDLISAMAKLPSVCEHIHLPIQAGEDKLLEEMNRGYTTAYYRAIVDHLRARVPGLALTTDIMVGFPGETAGQFEESLRFYKCMGFDAAFTFAYSPRPGTAAAAREDEVERETKLARLQKLIDIQNRITVSRNKAGVGEEAEVLVDGPAARGEGLLAGRARNNKQIIFPCAPALAGSLVSVKLTEAHLWGFRGQLNE
jgi:tRNA-2-methylthio-N6-dimethylallyladenosine synthase